ncbi:hypothetical protein KBD33_06280 [Candidatus Gracilibacteria bacterium]|nr:hypothetical protein [Candidatus Gracilibacteria bacterium]
MRLLPKWIQDVSKNISADVNIRPVLAGVHITNTHVGATNSFIAIRAELNPKYVSEKFPGMGIDAIPDEGIIIPSKLIDDIKFKPHKNYDVVDKKAVIRTLDEDYITISTTDLDNEISYKSRFIKGKMPDLEAFHKKISESEKKEEIAFGIEYMVDMLNTFKAMGHDSLILSTHVEQGIVLKPYKRNEDTWGLVMPLKL